MTGAAHPTSTSSPLQNSMEQLRVPRQSWGGGRGRAQHTVPAELSPEHWHIKQGLTSQHLPAQLSGNANTQHFSQPIGVIKGRCDCAANVIYSEPQIPSSAAFFLPLEYKQPDLSFTPGTSLRWDSCLLSWLGGSNKAGNFTSVIPKLSLTEGLQSWRRTKESGGG